MTAPAQMLLEKAREECARHAELLRYALGNLEPIRPLDGVSLESSSYPLSEEKTGKWVFEKTDFMPDREWIFKTGSREGAV